MPVLRSAEPPPPSAAPPGGPNPLWIAAALGLGAGAGELVFLALRKYARGLFVFQPPEVLWMAPAADLLVIAGIIALVVAGVRVARGRPPGQSTVTGLAAGLAAFTLLLLLPPIHPAASAMLAAGVGVLTSRRRLAADPRLARVARTVVGVSVVLLAGVAVGLGVTARLRERRALARLSAAAPDQPNVLLIILDTVRALNLSIYGYDRPTTPALERWADRGTRFTRAQSTAPWTLPSHASLFTGHEAHELSTDWYDPLDDRYPTLAEHLAGRGYLTAGFVANLPYTNREVGLARGFQHYEDWPISIRQFLVSGALVRAVTGSSQLRDLIGNHDLVVRKSGRDISDAFLRWVDARGERPFFAFLNYYDAHTPFVPPEPFRSRFAPPGAPFHADLTRKTDSAIPWDTTAIRGAMNAYDGAIAYLDHELDRLFQALDQRGLLAHTLIVLTSDHGEEFAEHQLFSHGNSLYLPSLWVPLLLWLPGRVPADFTIDAPVSLRDLPATVAALTGSPADPAPFPGRTLSRFWTPRADSGEAPIYTEVRHAPKLPAWYPSTKGDLLGVQTGLLRLIRNGDATIEVYDIGRDPLERHNLAADPALADSIARLRELAGRARPPRTAP